MSIGKRVRGALGPLERPVSGAYRAFFVSLSHQVDQIRRWNPDASSILEVGCGEGPICELIATRFPEAQVTGIDIIPEVGRLFQGDRARVQFREATLRQFADEQPGTFDLILICDVLHHVPWEQHQDLLEQAGRLLAPGGAVVVKDWERFPNFVHLLCALSDRLITGDRVRYGSAGDFVATLTSVFGAGSVSEPVRLPPWRNNLMFLVRPSLAS